MPMAQSATLQPTHLSTSIHQYQMEPPFVMATHACGVVVAPWVNIGRFRKKIAIHMKDMSKNLIHTLENITVRQVYLA